MIEMGKLSLTRRILNVLMPPAIIGGAALALTCGIHAIYFAVTDFQPIVFSIPYMVNGFIVGLIVCCVGVSIKLFR